MWENTRSHIYYLAQFLLDTLFDENYGDGSGDITHYLTDERMERIEHNNKIMDKMYEVVEMKISGSITEDEMGVMIHELHEQYI